MIILEELEKNKNWKEIKYSPSSYPYASKLFQKAARNNKGDKKLYYIQLAYYPPDKQYSVKAGWKADARLYALGNRDFDVTLHARGGNEETLEGVERFFAEIYEQMDCIPDVHNN
ncbi:MAG TPA: hypothetical protein ENI23_00540 [bacterium]|nr:hypothetical protein [bacterium]